MSGNGQVLPPQGGRVQIKLEDCEPVACKECKCELFTTAFRIMKVPITHASPDAGRQIHVEEYICRDCNKETGIRKGI